MHWLLTAVEFVVHQILSVPAYLIGLITAAGLTALRRSAGQIVGGALKATLGFLLIGAGASLVVDALAPLGVMIQGATGAHGVIPTNEAIVGIAQAEFGSRVAWIMILGFALSLLLARLTPLRYVFLTGHHMLFMATLITMVMAAVRLPTAVVVLVGGVVLAVMLVAMPALAHPWTQRVTGNNTLAIGHFGTAGYIAAGATGQLVGRRSRSTEEMKLPEGLRFLRDSMAATALSMVLVHLVVAAVYLASAGPATAFKAFPAPAADGGDYIMKSVMQGLQFGVAVAVILFGVRTILGELVPAFRGIGEKVVPGAVPALDAPIVFPFAQNAVLIGFIASFVGGMLSLAAIAVLFGPAFGLALVLPGLVPHFFTGGTAGVYGNATGGRRGAIAGAFLNGVLITFLPAVLLGVLGEFGTADTTFGDADFGWLGTLTGYAAKAGPVTGVLLILAIAAGILALAVLVQKRVVEAGWDPGARRDAAADGASDAGADAGTSGSAPGTGTGDAADGPRRRPTAGNGGPD